MYLQSIFVHGYEFWVLGGVRNIGLLLTLIITLYVMDGLFRIYNTCITPVHWLIGTLFGFLLGNSVVVFSIYDK